MKYQCGAKWNVNEPDRRYVINFLRWVEPNQLSPTQVEIV